jgi:hypothetical protein
VFLRIESSCGADELSGSLKVGTFLDQMNDCQLPKRDFALAIVAVIFTGFAQSLQADAQIIF